MALAVWLGPGALWNTSRGTISSTVYPWCFLELRGAGPTGLMGASPAG